IVSDQGARVRDDAQGPQRSQGRDAGLGLRGLVEAAKAAGRALRSNLFRTALTLLGIVIGVGSVIAMLAVGDGAKQDVVDRISGMGTNLLLVRPAATTRGGMGSSVATMTPEDTDAIARVPNVL